MKSCSCSTVKAGGMRITKKQGNEENASGDKEIKKRPVESSSSAVNSSKMSFILARTIDKLNRNVPVSDAHQKLQPAVEKLPPPRQLHVIHQPRKQ
uniref:Death-associated protein-like 1-A n=1 Tax=Callorhinchus milii TaxID=7868 RepID=V9LJN3_CALMI